jgi:hypothetical protein
MSRPIDLPDNPTNADLGVAVRQVHLCLEDARTDVNHIKRAQKVLSARLDKLSKLQLASERDRHLYQDLMLRAFKINPDYQNPNSPQRTSHTVGTMSPWAASSMVVGAVTGTLALWHWAGLLWPVLHAFIMQLNQIIIR